MTVSQWIYNRVTNSTAVSAVIGTRCYPDYVPESTSIKGQNIPCVVYSNVSWSRNKLERMPIMQIKGIHDTKSDIESLNTDLYSLFDNTTAAIKEASSNLYIDNVNIINNLTGEYDPDNQNWFCIVDVNINYHF